MRTRRLPALIAASLFFAACSTDNPTSPVDQVPSPLVADVAHAGNIAVFFLPPLGAGPAVPGTFDGTKRPIVRITVNGALLVDLSPDLVRGQERYRAKWRTRLFTLDPARLYRIAVIVEGDELGFVTVAVVENGRRLRNVDTDEIIPLADDRTLPIEFRIDTVTIPALPILFLHDVGNANEDIYSVMPDGSALKRITDAPGRDYAPRWSPDRTRIAFSSERWCGGCGIAPELYVANPDGSGAVQVTHGLFSIYGISWSPDGTRFAIESQGGTYLPSETSIYTLNVNGTAVAKLTGPRTFEPDWSPDGSKILYQTYTPVGISVMNADGSGAQTLRTVSADTRGATWSPDGTRIAYGDQDHIWLMNSDGSGPVQLTSGAWIDGTPAWSPDGGYIAFHSNRTGVFQIYVMRSDGGNVQQVTHVTVGRAVNPSWR